MTNGCPKAFLPWLFFVGTLISSGLLVNQLCSRDDSRMVAVLLTRMVPVWDQSSRASPGIRMAISLSDRFPGTPKDETSAKIDWGKLHLWPSIIDPHSDLSHLNRHPLLSAVIRPATVGSRAWAAAYPSPDQIAPKPRRQWIRRLNWVKKHAQLNKDQALLQALSIPKATLEPDGLVSYPPRTPLGAGPGGACSWERSGCLRNSQNGYAIDQDIIDADNGTWVVNFDDGPLPPSKNLYKILDEFNAKATHFWIGGNVLKNWELALEAFKRGDHLAVHTWSHSHLTSLDDLQVLGELGWCIEIISDLTGKVPKYFRPPYGNIDNRIRAIAKHVFSLETVIWNYDSIDWGLDQTYSTGDQVDKPNPESTPTTLNQVISNILNHSKEFKDHKSIGRLILEHELSDLSILAFQKTWNQLILHGWKTGTLPDCIHQDWYLN